MRHAEFSWRPIVVALGVAVFASLCVVTGILTSLSAQTSDRFFLSHPTDPRITIVAIDDTSLGQLGRWPWPRSVHAELISKLAAAGAKVIAYDVNFPEASDASDDQALATALKSAGSVVLPVELQLGTANGQLTYDPQKVVAPIPLIASAARDTGHSNTPPDSDGTVRHVPLYVRAPDGSVMPSFAVQVSHLAGLDKQLMDAPLDRLNRLTVNFAGQPFTSFHTISAADVIRGKADLSSIKDGIVFVGSTAADLHDALLVPTSYGMPMPGVEIHASVFDTIAQARWLRPIPDWFLVLELFILAIGIGFLISSVRTRWNLIIVLILWIAIIVSSFFLFDAGWISDVVWPTLVIAATYAAVTLERRITADRQRRQLKTVLTRYVSPAVVESILKDPSKMKLGGDRRRMSVIFSDIRGFTTISEGLSPEKLVHVLNIYLSRMTDIVFANEGVLDKYIGDAVMAFWNAPLDQPDHALRAVKTAIAWQDALAEMNAANSFDGLELHIGAGVNTGDMIVGNVGGDARFDYTVIGDNVNLGSRLEGLTKEYGVRVLVSEATQKEIAKDILTRRLDKVAVKGKKEPVVIYEAMEDMGKASVAHKKLAVDFEAALESYFARNFSDAIAKCDMILKSTPEDGPTKLLIDRAKHFLENPPPADWAGTWVYTKK